VHSLAVIFAALTDILAAMAGMSILGIELTLGSLAALLMLLGYSVDTDILLSTRVLKQREGSLADRIWSSVLTGSTMSLAAIFAFAALYLVSPSSTLDQIAAVIVIGLAADLPITWLGNAFILKWYVERD
jgi:preprotein translocase subunit SecF